MRTTISVHGLLYRVETQPNQNGGFNKVVKFKGDEIVESEFCSEKEYHLSVRKTASKYGFPLLNNECSIIN